MRNNQKTFSVAVSKEMIPDSQILVYGLLNEREVLVDSLTFHVDGLRGSKEDV